MKCGVWTSQYNTQWSDIVETAKTVEAGRYLVKRSN